MQAVKRAFINMPPADRGLEHYEEWPAWHFPSSYIEQLKGDLEERLKERTP